MCLQIIPRNLAVAEDLREKTSPDGLATMDRDHGAPSIRVSQEVVAAPYPDKREAEFVKRLDQASCRERSDAAHEVTTTR